MNGPILITGGKGKTGSRVAARLSAAGLDARIGTRSPNGPQDRRFDWADVTSATAFYGCHAAYLVAPTDRTDHLAVMQPMLEAAMARGVRRFVLLSASLIEAGGPMMGEVHAWLAQNADEWTVLRPSWFMQNFSEGLHGDSIRQEAAIYSATGSGKVGFVSADDIAAAAAAALTAKPPLNADFVLTGPEVLSYDNVAAIITATIGQPVRHVALDPAQLTARFQAQGVPPAYAETLTRLDLAIRDGAEDRMTRCVEDLTGTAPISFAAFAKDAAVSSARREA